MQSQTLSNSIVSSYAYNPRSFLTDLLNKGGSTTLSEFGGSTPSTAMTYDALGDVTSVKANVPAAPSSYSGTTSYQYDAKTELTQEASTRSGGYTNANSYDPAENPTQVRGVAQPTANADNHLPVSGVTFDGNGNPSKVEGLTATFDILNRATGLGVCRILGAATDFASAREVRASCMTAAFPCASCRPRALSRPPTPSGQRV